MCAYTSIFYRILAYFYRERREVGDEVAGLGHVHFANLVSHSYIRFYFLHSIVYYGSFAVYVRILAFFTEY